MIILHVDDDPDDLLLTNMKIVGSVQIPQEAFIQVLKAYMGLRGE